MRGASNFFLGVFLSVGLLCLVTIGTSLISSSKTNNVVKEAYAVNQGGFSGGCTTVGATDNRTCVTSCNGKTVSGTESFQCQSNLQWYSDGRCYATECTGTSGVAATTNPASSTTTQASSANCQNSTAVIGPVLEKLCQIGSFFNQGGIFNLASWAGEGIMRFLVSAIGGGQLAYGDRPDLSTLAQDPKGQGALVALGSLTDSLYHTPSDLHTTSYFADLSPFKKARAAEQINRSGQEILGPIKLFWQGMRNVAYALYVVVLVAIGFMVMFRSKIDPRTVVSVSAAIPNIVISLVLITFSFAIAGFLVDIGNVLSELVKNILSTQVGIPASKQTDTGLASLFGSFVFNLNFGQLSSTGAISAIGGLLLKLIFVFVAFYAAISIFFTLLIRYVGLIVKAIFAPLAFLFGALPGQSGTISGWFKSYLVDVLSFPIILFIVNLAKAITISGQSTNYADQIRLPTSVGAGDAGENISALVGIIILILATKVPAFLEEHLDTKPSGHVEKAGTNFSKAASATPIIGRLFGGK